MALALTGTGEMEHPRSLRELQRELSDPTCGELDREVPQVRGLGKQESLYWDLLYSHISPQQ